MKDELKFIEKNFEKMRDKDLARELEISLSTLRRRRKTLDLKRLKRIRLGDKPNFDVSFFDVLNEKNCYFLGYLFADGWIHKRSEYSYTMAIELKDKEMIKEFAKLLKSNSVRKHRSNLVLTFSNLKVAKRLMALGFTQKKARTIRLPKIPKKLMKHFVRGYFDGDGCVRIFNDARCTKIQAQGSITSCSKGILTDLQKWLKFGNIHQNRNSYCLMFGKKDCLKFSKIIYKDATIFLQRKKSIFEVLQHG